MQWSLDEDAVAAAKALDGCYVIKTTVSEEAMSKDQVVMRYKSLAGVEQAFRNMKSVSLEMRPIHHKKDDRIRAHVFLCMLAYYLLWHFLERLEPLFAKQDADIKGGKQRSKERAWTVQSVLETLKSVRRNEVRVGGAEFQQITELNADQQELLRLLRVQWPKIM